MLLHLFALLVAGSTALLIFAGGLVTSTGSGLSVPDWPTTYGWFMLTFPLDKMVGGIFYEHSHRLIASMVGLLIVVLATWLWRTEPRHWVRRLGYIAVAAVITQGILGGITVLWFLPDAISIAHAGLAQLVFCLTVSIALFTSPGWRCAYTRKRTPQAARGASPPTFDRRGIPDDCVAPPSNTFSILGRLALSSGRFAGLGATRDLHHGLLANDRPLQAIAMLTTTLVYTQILVGATMRHTDAGLAIPDFPLAFGQLVPPFWNPQIAIHYAHRVGALVVSAFVLATAGHVLYHHVSRPELQRPSLLLLALLAIQIALGALTVLSGKHYIINSLHVVTGALVLGTSLVLALRTCRPRFAVRGSDPIPSTTRGFEPSREWGLTPGTPGARA